MKPGRRTPSPDSKLLSGTFRADRHANIIQISEPPKDEPRMPGYMSPEGKSVWVEEIARVTACGAVAADSSLFARYCELEALFRIAILQRDMPSGVIVTELRRTGELLGIAGHRSRLARSGVQPAKDSPPSPFAPRKR